MSEWNDLISNWSFNATDSDGNEFSPASFTKGVTQSVDEAYELTTVTISFGNANVPYHQQAFSADFSFDVNCDANLIDITVSSDDTASVTAGNVTASSTLYHPGNASSAEWIANPTGVVHVEGRYNNIGGPYNLNITITLKKSIREIYFLSETNTPDEIKESESMTEEDARDWLIGQLKKRTKFGSGEVVQVEIKNTKGETLSESPIGTAENCYKDNETGIVYLQTNVEKDSELTVSLTFSDGDVVTKSHIPVLIPKYETARQIDRSEYWNSVNQKDKEELIKLESLTCHTFNFYRITVKPTDVSFDRLYFWEEAKGATTASGIFELLNQKHTPSAPQTPTNNDWLDIAGYGFDPTDEIIQKANQIKIETGGDIVGVLVWPCPVRWDFNAPATLELINSQDDSSNKTLPERLQTTTIELLSDSTFKIDVTKTFGTTNS